MWITNLINESEQVYATNTEALAETKKIITRWAESQNVNAYLRNATNGSSRKNCNRTISILTKSGKGYDYKFVIHFIKDGFTPSLQRLNNSGYSCKEEEYLHLSFKYYNDDPTEFEGKELEKIEVECW